MAKRTKRSKRQRGYAAKRERQGSDYYGQWKDGKRTQPERIAGKMIY